MLSICRAGSSQKKLSDTWGFGLNASNIYVTDPYGKINYYYDDDRFKSGFGHYMQGYYLKSYKANNAITLSAGLKVHVNGSRKKEFEYIDGYSKEQVGWFISTGIPVMLKYYPLKDRGVYLHAGVTASRILLYQQNFENNGPSRMYIDGIKGNGRSFFQLTTADIGFGIRKKQLSYQISMHHSLFPIGDRIVYSFNADGMIDIDNPKLLSYNSLSFELNCFYTLKAKMPKHEK